MSRHLSPEEFVDALEGPSPAAANHLAACAECRDELASLETTLRHARSENRDALEPSPLFWDHFSARVKQATADEPVGRDWRWWPVAWKPAAALLVVAGALAIGFFMRPEVQPVGSVAGGAQPAVELASSGLPAFEDDGSWSLVTALASELDWNELSQAAEPAEGVADAMIEELTSEQREALARLLQKEMGDL